jgi:hypothetical protein
MENNINESINNKLNEKRKRNCGGPQVKNMPKKKKLKKSNIQNIIYNDEESE